MLFLEPAACPGVGSLGEDALGIARERAERTSELVVDDETAAEMLALAGARNIPRR